MHHVNYLIAQACAAHGVTAIHMAPNCWKVGVGTVEFDPTRSHRKWEAEYWDDENNTVIRQYDHAYEAVRSVT